MQEARVVISGQRNLYIRDTNITFLARGKEEQWMLRKDKVTLKSMKKEMQGKQKEIKEN